MLTEDFTEQNQKIRTVPTDNSDFRLYAPAVVCADGCSVAISNGADVDSPAGCAVAAGVESFPDAVFAVQPVASRATVSTASAKHSIFFMDIASFTLTVHSISAFRISYVSKAVNCLQRFPPANDTCLYRGFLSGIPALRGYFAAVGAIFSMIANR